MEQLWNAFSSMPLIAAGISNAFKAKQKEAKKSEKGKQVS